MTDERVRWQLSHAFTSLVIAVIASLVVSGLVFAAGGYEVGLQHGRGADLGRVAGRLAVGEPLKVDEPPIGVTALMQLPLWIGLIGVPWLVAGRSWRRLVDAVRLTARSADAPLGLAVGVLMQLVVVPLVYVPIFWIFGDLDIAGPARTLASKAHGAGVLLLVLIVGVGAPLVEEMFFRGVMLGALRERLRTWPAILASAAVFGAFHFQFQQFPALFVFGVVLAWLTVRFDRLGPAIYAHLAFNLTTVVILLTA